MEEEVCGFGVVFTEDFVWGGCSGGGLWGFLVVVVGLSVRR